ncbi:MAG: hypothetical protein ABSC41_20900 [Acidimicrobiales bacterium]
MTHHEVPVGIEDEHVEPATAGRFQEPLRVTKQMEVGTTYAIGNRLHQDLPWTGFRFRKLVEHEPPFS